MRYDLIVMKFGGTSVADTHHILNVAKKTLAEYKMIINSGTK